MSNSTRATRALLCIVLACGADSVAAQQQTSSRPATSRPTHSLQDQLVRHFLERENLELPTVRRSVELGDGTGAMAMLARRADGTLEFQTLDRRALGGPVEPPILENVPVEIEEVEEPDGPVPAPPPAPPKAAPRTVPPRKEALQDAPEPAEKSGPAPQATVRIALHRPRAMPDDVELSIDGQSIARGARLDLDALRHALKSRPREVIVEAAPQIPFGQVLAIAAEARAAGARVAFGGSFAGDIDPEESETIRSMPRALGWERGDDRLHDQEIVMCFDRREPWSKVARTLLEFAELRIWRLSFAGVDEAGRRTKVPVPLSVHR